MSILELYELSFEDNNAYHFVDIELVSSELAQRILQITGIDVENFVITMDNYGIKHTIKRHGDDSKETQQGQIGVEAKDFELIPQIINHADEIHYSTRQKSKNSPIVETLIFEKEIDAFYYVLKEIRRVSKKGKTNRLIFQTMYITKKRRKLQ
jgi:hypothetical protein